MTWALGFAFLSWIISRESKYKCNICHCNRKMKHLTDTLFGMACDGGCLHIAFITGRPFMKNGQIEVEYNWDRT